MLTAALLCDLVDYSYWATDRQLSACEPLTAEERATRCGGSFESLDATLGHLLAAEKIWLHRFRNGPPAGLEPVRFATIDELREQWRPVRDGLIEFARGLDDAALGGDLTYTKLNGERWSYPLWAALMHLMNHQTYHRGQITLLLRQLGKVPPGVDYLIRVDGSTKARS